MWCKPPRGGAPVCPNRLETVQLHARTSQLGVVGVDQERELDLRGGDSADVDAVLGQRLEGLGSGDPGVAAHAPTPITDTLATSVAPSRRSKPILGRAPLTRRMAARS